MTLLGPGKKEKLMPFRISLLLLVIAVGILVSPFATVHGGDEKSLAISTEFAFVLRSTTEKADSSPTSTLAGASL